jgi:hypothetical protein
MNYKRQIRHGPQILFNFHPHAGRTIAIRRNEDSERPDFSAHIGIEAGREIVEVGGAMRSQEPDAAVMK